jgi:NADPH:quinone reductase-like Zn-dependent oxidoreductase
MRAVVLARHGGFDALRVQERPVPACGPGQVRIAVHAAGVNFADTMARVGLYPDAPPVPCVLGYEVAGEVVERGPGVRGVAIGDRVMAATRFGGYAEEVVVTAHDAVPLPGGVSFAEGAAVPLSYSTAWAALVDAAGLRPGERVLVHAAAGGVGIAATQIARGERAEVWGTASPGKHDPIRAQGVEHAIDYTRKGWDHALPPFDVVLDPVGGASFRRSYRLLRPGGRLVAYGAQATMGGERRDLRRAVPAALAMIRGFDLVRQMRDSKTVIGLNMLRLWDDRGTLEPWLAPLREGLAMGVLRPVVAEAVPFSRAGDAHRILAERRNVGKVVLVPDGRMG